MRLTYKGDYALKAVLYLAVRYDTRPVTIHEMARELDIPVKFLEQILLSLKKGAFVESKRGKVGGYNLAKDPSRVTVGEIVRFVDGPIEPIACIEHGYAGCKDTYRCAFRPIWKRLAAATSDIVDTVTFEALANDLRSAKGAATYTI